MRLNDFPSPMIAIVGPTGSGKTQLGIKLAKILNGEIISVDSRLVYRGMDIGTAKPSLTEMDSIPHHMIDIIDPDQSFSLVQFCEQAKIAINKIQNKGSLPILVGGTGQYIHALIENWNSPVQPPNFELRKILSDAAEDLGGKEIHHKLTLIDPHSAATIDPKNIRRTIRALEVSLLTGKRFSDQRIKGNPEYSSIIIGIHVDRKKLYEQLDLRLDKMLVNGLVEEVKCLIAKYDPHMPAFEAIGYKQIIQYLEGDFTYDEAIAKIKQLTHQFVRRQSNWFRANDTKIHWIESSPNSVDDIIKIINQMENWQIKPEN